MIRADVADTGFTPARTVFSIFTVILLTVAAGCSNCTGFLDGTLQNNLNDYVDECLYETQILLTAPDSGTIIWIDENGNRAEIEVSAAEQLSLTTSKGFAIPVLFYPEQEETPLGLIHPFYPELSEAGFSVAKLLFRFIMESDKVLNSVYDIQAYASRFNWKQLQQKLEASGGIMNDETAFLESLAEGSFTAETFRRLLSTRD